MALVLPIINTLLTIGVIAVVYLTTALEQG